MKHVSRGLALSGVLAFVCSCGGAGAQGGFLVESGPPPPPPSGEIVVAGSAGAGAAPAEPGPESWTLAEKQYWAKLQEEMDWFAKRANDHCGNSQITATYAHESFRGMLTAGGNYGLPQYTRLVCTTALSAITEVCTDGPAAKQAVASKVTHVVCEWGPTSYALKGGVFHVRVDASNEQASFYLRGMGEFLRNRL